MLDCSILLTALVLGQVTNLQRFTQRLVYRMRELSVIKTELGVACNIYAEIEQDRLANSFRRVGDGDPALVLGLATPSHVLGLTRLVRPSRSE